MRILMASAWISAGMLVAVTATAQAPVGSTGECKDGTYTSAERKTGACASHGGIKDWYKSATPAPSTPLKAPATAMAPAGAQAPAGSTGECKDGSYTSATRKTGACASHGGVKDWYQGATPAPSVPATAPATATAPAAPATPAPAAAPVAKKAAPAAAAAPAAGGGPGQVWVNTASKVYHCSGDKWYGKTIKGKYMTEAAAKAAGNRPDHGKACS
jgi:hypothetical protein